MEMTMQQKQSPMTLPGNGSGDSTMQGILTHMKASELPFEAANEFSDAPFEFEETTKWLWDDTKITYYHAEIENRFSENYLKLCGRLEKNIRKLGSSCLTKAVMEQKGLEFPKLSDLSILELVKMVSLHLRKCHAAFNGCYYDNNFLGMSYLNWEFRWFELGNRLKATEVKIGKIKAGLIKADSILEQTEKFKDEPRTNDRPEKDITRGMNLNPSALPIDGSAAREMLKNEKEAAREEAKAQRELEKERRASEPRHTARPFDLARPFDMPSAFPILDDFLSDHGTFSADHPDSRSYWPDEEWYEEIPDSWSQKSPETLSPVLLQPAAKQEPEIPPGCISEAEARSTLIKDAMERGDQESLMAIPQENTAAVHARWERYCERLEQEIAALEKKSAAPPKQTVRAGPDAATRKKLRSQRKKKK